MKIGIIGAGLVGSTTAYSLATNGIAREIVLIDINRNRAESEALDITHATPYSFPCQLKSVTYADLEGADIIIITAGIHRSIQQNRRFLQENLENRIQHISVTAM